MPRLPLPSGADVGDRGRGRGRRQCRLPPRRGGRRRRPARARSAGQRLDLEGRGRPARPVLGRAQYRDLQAQPRGVQAVRAAAGLGDRLRGDRLPLPAHHRDRGRRVHAQRGAAERARRAVADHHPRRGARALPAARGRGHPGGELLPDRCARDARVGRAGLRRRCAPARRAHRRVDAGRGDRRGRRRHQARAYAAWGGGDRHGHLRRGCLVAHVWGDGGRTSSTSRRCAARCCSPRRWQICRPSCR